MAKAIVLMEQMAPWSLFALGFAFRFKSGGGVIRLTDFKSMVGHRIRVARADARMSQEELAKTAGVSAARIKNYENGESCPLLQTAVVIAEALGITVNDLCGIPKSVA